MTVVRWHFLPTAQEKAMPAKRLEPKAQKAKKQAVKNGYMIPTDINPTNADKTPCISDSRWRIRGLPTERNAQIPPATSPVSPAIQPPGERRCTGPAACVCSISPQAKPWHSSTDRRFHNSSQAKEGVACMTFSSSPPNPHDFVAISYFRLHHQYLL